MQNAIDNQAKIADIKRRMHSGELTYEDAQIEAKPVIDRMNASGRAIAKKHGLRPKLLTFGEIMR